MRFTSAYMRLSFSKRRCDTLSLWTSPLSPLTAEQPPGCAHSLQSSRARATIESRGFSLTAKQSMSIAIRMPSSEDGLPSTVRRYRCSEPHTDVLDVRAAIPVISSTLPDVPTYLSVCTVEESFARPSARGWSSAYRTPSRAILSCAAFTSGRSVIWAEVSGVRCNRPCFCCEIDAVAHAHFCHEINTCSEIRPLQHGRLPRVDMHFILQWPADY